jgi:hypothetical protein
MAKTLQQHINRIKTPKRIPSKPEKEQAEPQVISQKRNDEKILKSIRKNKEKNNTLY